MPLFDMRCSDCGHEFTLFCSRSQRDKSQCPECGSDKIKTVYKSVAVLSGSGSGGSSYGANSGGGGFT